MQTLPPSIVIDPDEFTTEKIINCLTIKNLQLIQAEFEKVGKEGSSSKFNMFQVLKQTIMKDLVQQKRNTNTITTREQLEKEVLLKLRDPSLSIDFSDKEFDEVEGLSVD